VTDDIVTRLRLTTVADSSHKIYAAMTEAADEIQTLRALAEDMYIVLSNEIGDNSVTKAYQAYIERHQND
jgi:hypothetical protein